MMIMMKTMSPNQTYQFGRNLAKTIKAGAVICLEGNLGAGKTLFVQGVAKGLGISEEVTSPTFSLMNIYEGKYAIYHFDLYRLRSAEELEDVGFYEYTQRENDVVIIEWPDHFLDELPDEYLWIKIERGESENERLFHLIGKGDKYKDWVEELKEICRF